MKKNTTCRIYQECGVDDTYEGEGEEEAGEEEEEEYE